MRTKDAPSIGAAVKEDGIERGLDALFTEAERVTRFGFTASELDRQKTSMLRASSGPSPKRTTRNRAASPPSCIRNFLDSEPIPGIVYEQGLYKRFLPEITLTEVNALAKDWMPDRNRDRHGQRAAEAGTDHPDRGQALGGAHVGRRQAADGLGRFGRPAAASRGRPARPAPS